MNQLTQWYGDFSYSPTTGAASSSVQVSHTRADIISTNIITSGTTKASRALRKMDSDQAMGTYLQETLSNLDGDEAP